MIASGIVLSLHRWPVKSMGGEPAGALRIDARGVAGDRMHALVDETRGAPRRLTAREAPAMLRWHAAYPDHPGDALDPDAVPPATLTAPGGERFAWDDPALPAALATSLARPVTLRRDPALQQDLENTLLVTVAATHSAVEEGLGHPLDLRRWRTNAHVALDAPAFAEEDWEGATLHIGDATFTALHPCERCVLPTRDPDTTVKDPEILRWLTRERRMRFGINVRPRGVAVIRAGDPVLVV